MNTGKSILVADDEPGLRDLFHYALGPLGYDVVTVPDGTAAVAEISERAFDLVILDIHMPGMCGPHALSAIRKLRPQQKLLVLSGASFTSDGAHTQVFRESGVRCLFKPMTFDEIIEAIESTLEEGASC